MHRKEIKAKTSSGRKNLKSQGSAKKNPATVKSVYNLSNVTFNSEGQECSGMLYMPRGSKKVLLVVMAHGIGAEMSFSLSVYAEEFARNGYAVLVFDYRYFGASAGEPRHFISPQKQLKDWASAIEYGCSIERVDRENVCLWGYSFSGGHVITMVARNSRAKGFIISMPFMDSFFILKSNGMIKNMKINITAAMDMLSRLARRKPYTMPIIGRTGEFAAMNTPEVYDGYSSLIPRGSGWRNETPAWSMMTIISYRPFKLIKNIKSQGLVFYGENDSLTDNKKVEKYFSGNSRYRLVKLKCGHFEVFRGVLFKQAINAQLEFLEDLFRQK